MPAIVEGIVQGVPQLVPSRPHVLSRQLAGGDRHLAIDHRLFEGRGRIQFGAPELLPERRRVRPELLGPEAVPDGLVSLPRPLLAPLGELIATIGDPVPVSSSQIPTVSDIVAVGGAPCSAHAATVSRWT
jgi:hypothetical protein